VRCSQSLVSVEVDGLIYLEVQDAQRAAYGIDNYLRAASQLAQTTLRSAIGKIDLDKTFEERKNQYGSDRRETSLNRLWGLGSATSRLKIGMPASGRPATGGIPKEGETPN
jgi:regulator of protease activity HflC (stomatin/prohibitin superfamily)